MSDLMDKIGALLLKAERTDNEHERDAYLSKAQSLATLASVDLEAARLRQENKEKRETPIVETLTLFDWSNKSKTKAYFVWLAVELARVNDVKITIASSSNYVTFYGFPSDIEVTKALYASLSVQMVSECEAWMKTGEYKKEMKEYEQTTSDGWYTTSRWVTKPVDGRTARRSFYEAFREKVASRLREAKREAMKDAAPVVTDTGSTSAELVLASKQDAVAKFFDEKFGRSRGTYRGSGAGGGSSTGRKAGTAAGARARMGGGASVGGSKRMIG